MQTLRQETKQAGLLPTITRTREAGLHTSIFVPFYPGEADVEIRTRSNNAYNEAFRRLAETMRHSEAEEFLGPIRSVLDERHPETGVRGIAVFRCHGSFYHTYLKEEPPELVVVASSFHIKPLIHCLASRSECFVLTLGAPQVKIYRVFDGEVDLLKTYANEKAERPPAIRGELMRERRRNKEVTEQFIQKVARQVGRDFALQHRYVALLGARSLVKLMAGELESDSKAEVFHQGAAYPSLDAMATDLEAQLRLRKKQESQSFVENVMGSADSSLVTSRLEEIAEAAVHGRIECLMIDPTIQVWGLFDRDLGHVRTHKRQISTEDDCVVDDITEEVLRLGGDVVFFDSRQLGRVAPYMATLRW